MTQEPQNYTPQELNILTRVGQETKVLADILPIIARFGGKVSNIVLSGRKKLAYKIDDEEYAGDVCIEYLEPLAIDSHRIYSVLEPFLIHSDSILRYIDVRIRGEKIADKKIADYTKKFLVGE